jgi:hypothetical protein
MSGLGWFSRDLTKLVGDLVPGRVYVVIAPTGTGKTTFTTSLIADLLGYTVDSTTHRFEVMAFPTEESWRLHTYLACHHFGVTYKSYENGMLQEDKQRIRLQAKVYREDLSLNVLPEINLRFAHLLRHLRLTIEDHHAPNVLILDHIHRLDREGQQLPKHLEEVIRGLQKQAIDWNMAVIVMAQVHRPSHRDYLHKYRIPALESVKACAEIEQCGDVVLGLSKKLQDRLEKGVLAELVRGTRDIGPFVEPNTMRVTCLKHRIDSDAVDRSVLLTVADGRVSDRLPPDSDLPF